MTDREAVETIFGLAFQQLPSLSDSNQVLVYTAAGQILELLRLASAGATATAAASDRDKCNDAAANIGLAAGDVEALAGKFPFPTFP